MAKETSRDLRINKIAQAIQQLGSLDERSVRNALLSLGISGVDVRRSYLQNFAEIKNDSTNYIFNMGQGRQDSVKQPYSLLRDQEGFIVTSMTQRLVRVTNATLLPDGTEHHQTFVNPNVFVAAAGFTPAHLNAFFKTGELEWKVDSKATIWSGFPSDLFEVVPQTQKTGATNENQYDGNMGKVVPPFASVLDGMKRNEFILNVTKPGTTQWASATAGVVHFVCVRLDGFWLTADALKGES